MSKKIYVDAVHPEETRVVVVDSATNRVSDFDVETTTKPQIKGNIYLAKVIDGVYDNNARFLRVDCVHIYLF